MSQGVKEYAVTFAVAAAPHEAAKLRTILRETMEQAGFRVTHGATVVERWLVEAMAVPPAPFHDTRGRPEAEHMGKIRARRDYRQAQ